MKMYVSKWRSEIATTIKSLNGLRQECPMSMHLFVRYIEPQLIKIENAFEGMKVFNEKLCCRAYVDDIFVSSTMQYFCIRSNSRVNNTSQESGIGSWSSKTDWPIPWLQTVTTLKARGIPFEPDITTTEMKTWDRVQKTA